MVAPLNRSLGLVLDYCEGLWRLVGGDKTVPERFAQTLSCEDGAPSP